MTARQHDLALLVLRLAVGGLMLLHGIHKIRQGFDAGLSGVESMLVNKGLPEALAIGVYLGEILAPLALLVGWFVRPAALLVAFTMVMSIWLAYSDRILDLNQHGGSEIELNLLYLAGALALALSGGGRLAPPLPGRGGHED
jgi:putative oxidoreductase